VASIQVAATNPPPLGTAPPVGTETKEAIPGACKRIRVLLAKFEQLIWRIEVHGGAVRPRTTDFQRQGPELQDPDRIAASGVQPEVHGVIHGHRARVMRTSAHLCTSCLNLAVSPRGGRHKCVHVLEEIGSCDRSLW
jgi:hypothetical protein